ncbi:hypothetical protein [uncultured Thiodictyon sp.]|uniref:hypothetical protein n=1 Tax=uncultured Thiodictyon sp. TaxID=1846217 RepID=UPI0025F9085B|nr:hypothetical protein [uncultured Thiodictyon sp.]
MGTATRDTPTGQSGQHTGTLPWASGEVRAQTQVTELAAALTLALGSLDRHDLRLALILGELGDIELPPGLDAGEQAESLAALGPFYLAYQLEQAGLLRTAETVAGLYAGGAITADLGTAGQLLRHFWQGRRNRLTLEERQQLFGRVFESPHFERLFAALVGDIVSQADNRGVPDWREAAALEQSARRLSDFLAERAGGMTAYAARDIVSAINESLRFLGDPALQRAFGVTNLWALVRAAAAQGDGATFDLQRHLDLGQSGQVILRWFARAARGGPLHLDGASADFPALMMAAETWRQAQGAPA